MSERTIDGVRLRYDDAGAGHPAIVLLHGWCCDASFLAPQRLALAPAHRVIAPDLPWHGASGAPAGAPRLGAMVDAVVGLCAALDVTRPIVVGHSMGGLLAVMLAARTALDPRALVLLDARIEGTGSPQADVRRALAERLAGPEFRAAMRDYVRDTLSAPGDDPATLARVADVMSAAPQEVMLALRRQMDDTDGRADLAACRCPVLYVGASRPAVRLSTIAATRPGIEIVRVTGAGHFLQLLVPDQVNAAVRDFVARSTAASGPG